VVWQTVDAVVNAGLWDSTVFMLTWDDWGGYDDHVATPNVETDLAGVQLAYGPRLPLLMFGGRVKSGIDSRWCSHVSITKTALQLLGCRHSASQGSTTIPARRSRRRERAPCRVRASAAAFGTTIVQPSPPTPAPAPLPPSPVTTPTTVGPVLLRDGTTLPPPGDVVV